MVSKILFRFEQQKLQVCRALNLLGLRSFLLGTFENRLPQMISENLNPDIQSAKGFRSGTFLCELPPNVGNLPKTFWPGVIAGLFNV